MSGPSAPSSLLSLFFSRFHPSSSSLPSSGSSGASTPLLHSIREADEALFGDSSQHSSLSPSAETLPQFNVSASSQEDDHKQLNPQRQRPEQRKVLEGGDEGRMKWKWWRRVKGCWSCGPNEEFDYEDLQNREVTDNEFNREESLDQERHDKSPSSHRSLRLAIYVVLSVAITAANAISWKRTLNRFRAVDGSVHNMEFFVVQLTIVSYVVLAALILAWRWPSISAEQRRYPQSRFAMMGFLDAVAGLCSSLGGAFSSGQVQTVLNQMNIPITMLLSFHYLDSEFSKQQIFGSAFILFGSIVAALPSQDSNDSTVATTTWFGPLILIASCFPNSASNVVKEHQFKNVSLDVFFLTSCVSLYQFLLGFAFIPLLALPSLGGIEFSHLSKNFHDGWLCFQGYHIRGFECQLSPPPWVVLSLYVFINFGLNVLLLYITKNGSALLLVISSALSLPFTNIIFTIPLFMGKEVEDFSTFNTVGLFFVIIGFLLYSIIPDNRSGEFMPTQSAGGTMMFIEKKVEPTLAGRRHSFDITQSPLLIAAAENRRKVAHQLFAQSQGGYMYSENRFFTPP